MSLLNIDNLTIGYDNNPLIKYISLVLNAGEIVTLIGPNGSGKSTLLRTVASLLEPIGGAIYLDDKSLHTLSERDRARLMSVMLTKRESYEYATCRDVINVGRYPYTNIYGRLSDKDREVIDKVIKLVGVNELLDREYTKISDGQRQRVLLARALVQEPKVLILDEPTSFLDVGYKIEFVNILKRLAREEKIGILMSLHELDLAYSISDRIVAITSDNRIDKIDTPEKVLTSSYIGELFSISDGEYSIEGGFKLSLDTSDCGCTGEKTQYFEDAKCDSTNIKKPRFLMVQGTMSSAGKSLVVAALCRIFKQDGYRVAPFKSQNMALNSYITKDGLEMGRAQVMQAEAAGIAPDVHMNPILLKPTSDVGSQVIVNGKVLGNMKAKEYFEYKKSLVPNILEAVEHLSRDRDIIVIEGAGSPAEINLKDNDIVNMGMAKLVDAPVLLVGDIDRGGVFAQLLGTLELLTCEERDRVKGLVVNKFRGDKTILDPGIEELVARSGKKVVGVLPYVNINLEDEDSLTEKFDRTASGLIDIAVIRLPHISNFTDFDVFEQIEEVSVRYVTSKNAIGRPDLIILPGSKNTIDDMRWLRENGIDIEIKRLSDSDTPIFGICGGYQMLGDMIEDPYNVEGGGSVEGLGLLPIKTILNKEKRQCQVEGSLCEVTGIFDELSNARFYGYEIHMGDTRPFTFTETETSSSINEHKELPNIINKGNVYGTYIHGIFDHEDVFKTVVLKLSEKKKINIDTNSAIDYRAFKDREYDRLANTMREHLDMDEIYRMMGLNK